MSAIRIIKKYPNRRLYDTAESRYITLADVRRLVEADEKYDGWAWPDDADDVQHLKAVGVIAAEARELLGGKP